MIDSSAIAVVVNPVLVLQPPYHSPDPMVNRFVTFGAPISGGTAPYNFTWYFGDGQETTGANVTHLYLAADNYTVRVTVSDGAGATNSTSFVVKVTTLPPPPPTPTGNASRVLPWEVYGVLGSLVGLGGALALVLLLARRGRDQTKRR
jgi:hypothetical protein